jgi:cyclopropane fatty-acyl-phospholipid synthase-like methyltransferase
MDQTIWDKIYQDYEKGGEAYATLSRGLEQVFIKFVESTEFPLKKAFDVGYGTGHYLVWLKAKGFDVDGIDSSETAHKMATKAVGQNDLVLGNIYEYEIPRDAFGFILSVHAIHHGLKKEVRKALDSVYNGLIDGGWVYLTLPKDNQRKDWKTHQTSTLITPGTYAPTEGPEKGLPHSFYSEGEIKELFSKYTKLNYKKGERSGWTITAQK